MGDKNFPKPRESCETDVGENQRRLREFSRDLLVEICDCFSEALEGKGPAAFGAWEKGYQELWGLLEEHDAVVDLADQQRDQIEQLNAVCEVYLQREQHFRGQAHLLAIRCEKLQEELDELKARRDSLLASIERGEFIPAVERD
ncbi:hypothetical protein AURDEDRAFT_126725 [Auricularia subglabra TFB-10046 SS5]|nr:hypothetical protein AURDEDRAFT_126725 [Auricularia subglabra TFB-10046 SS5]